MSTKPQQRSAYADEVYNRHLLETREWPGLALPFHVCIYRPDSRYAGRTRGFATIAAALVAAKRNVDTGRLKGPT